MVVKRGQDAVGQAVRASERRPAAGKEAPRGTLNEERWEEVVNAAAKVFAEKGYRAATLRDIAAELGMLKGSLYYYIETKEDLLYELLKRSHEAGKRRNDADPLLREGTPPERLAHFIRDYMAGLREESPSMIVSEADLGELQGARRLEITRLRRGLFDIPLGIVSEGIRNRDFQTSTTPYVVTATIFRILNTTIFWHRAERGPDWDAVTEWYVEFILKGLGSSTLS